MAVSSCQKVGNYTCVEKPQSQSLLCTFPEELIELILVHVDELSDRYHAALACKKIYRITGGSQLWIEQRAACERIFALNFPAGELPSPSIWHGNSWLAMGLYRQRFIHLFLNNYSMNEVAQMEIGKECSPIQSDALRMAWRSYFTRSVKNGRLDIYYSFRFSADSFALFLEVLKDRKEVVEIFWQCPINITLAAMFSSFLKEEGGRFRSITFSPSSRSATAETVSMIIDSLRYMPNLEKLTLDTLPFRGVDLRQLGIRMSGMDGLRQLHINFSYYRSLTVKEWAEVGVLLTSRTVRHLWIEGMTDIGLSVLEHALIGTMIPKICLRSGQLSSISEGILSRLIEENPYISLLDVSCNPHMYLDDLPRLAAVVDARQELEFGISGSRILSTCAASSSSTKQKRRRKFTLKLFH